MNTQAQRIYTNAHIGSQITRFPEPRTTSPRGIGALAAVSGGLFQGRARSTRAVIERLSHVDTPPTYAVAA